MAIIFRREYLLLHLLGILFLNYLRLGKGDDGPKAIFIFGDSTMDVGTNNFLNGSLATANRPYNGIDFAYSIATGRFSNGLNSADLLVRELGDYKMSPPPYRALVNYSDTFKLNIMRGVNFASGGAGVFEDTGKQNFGNVTSLSEQIRQFSQVCENITEALAAKEVNDDLISNSLYIISMGSNDIFDYLSSFSTTPPETLTSYFYGNYTIHLQNLYNLGARKFGIIGIPPVGCTPSARTYNQTNCLDEGNELAQAFHQTTMEMLQNLSSQFPDFKYSLGNTYQMTISIIDNSVAKGFKNVSSACCGNGTLNAQTGCEPGVNLCPKRDEYLFWDKFHPTQAASQMAAYTLAYAEGSEYVSPMNFSRLSML